MIYLQNETNLRVGGIYPDADMKRCIVFYRGLLCDCGPSSVLPIDIHFEEIFRCVAHIRECELDEPLIWLQWPKHWWPSGFDGVLMPVPSVSVYFMNSIDFDGDINGRTPDFSATIKEIEDARRFSLKIWEHINTLKNSEMTIYR